MTKYTHALRCEKGTYLRNEDVFISHFILWMRTRGSRAAGWKPGGLFFRSVGPYFTTYYSHDPYVLSRSTDIVGTCRTCQCRTFPEEIVH